MSNLTQIAEPEMVMVSTRIPKDLDKSLERTLVDIETTKQAFIADAIREKLARLAEAA